MNTLNHSILNEKTITAFAVLLAAQAFKSREAEASVVVHNKGAVDVYDTNKAPNERIKIVEEPEHGQVDVNQRTGEIKYLPDQEGVADSYEYDLVSDGMCTSFFSCPPILVLLAAVAGGISAKNDEYDCPKKMDNGFDFGDAPDSFATVQASDGAAHAITSGIILGQNRDANPDGLPSEFADGDDNDLDDDEDGLSMPNLNGQAIWDFNEPIPLELTFGGEGEGYVSMWIDFNGNGQFEEGETVQLEGGPELLNYAVAAGETLTDAVRIRFPEEAFEELPEPGTQLNLYLRVRVANDDVVDVPFGLITSGEVEDYYLTMETTYDFGDLPDDLNQPGFEEFAALQFVDSQPFLTTFETGGAGHLLNGTLFLGDIVDGDNDGDPGVDADNDDIVDAIDDEDGVTFYNILSGNGALLNTEFSSIEFYDLSDEQEAALVENDGFTNGATITINGNGSGYLNAWIDLDGDYEFDPDEHLAYNEPVNAGDTVTIRFDIAEPYLELDGVYSRFRVSDHELDSANGLALGGEVEDYFTQFIEFDYGDLPTGIGEGVVDYGEASHVIVDGVYLGQGVDPDPYNNYPVSDYSAADGDDDGDLSDDDDGVWFIPDFEGAGGNDFLFAELDDNEDPLLMQQLNEDDGFEHGEFLVGGFGFLDNNSVIVEVGPAGGYVYGWVDMNANEVFEEDELVVNTQGSPLTPGMHEFSFYFEDNFEQTPGEYIYSRFRITQDEQLDPDPNVIYSSGEVEDFSTPWEYFFIEA